MRLQTTMCLLAFILGGTPAVAFEPTQIVAHVYSHRDPEQAKAAFLLLQSKHPKMFIGRFIHILPQDVKGQGVWFRTFVGSHQSRGDASRYCERLLRLGQYCAVMVLPTEVLPKSPVHANGGIDLPRANNQEYHAVAANLARYVAGLLHQRRYSEIARLVHPIKGLRVSPYATADLKSDQVILPKQLLDRDYRKKRLVWGRGYNDADIAASIDAYFRPHPNEPNFSKAPLVGVMDLHPAPGSHINNIPIVYPGSFYFDLYFPPSKEGESDWASRRLVFEKHKERWFLVGMIDARWWP